MPIPVLFMIQHLDLGGSEYHFHDLVTRLDRSRFEPHVIYCDGRIVSERLEGLGWLPVTRIPLHRLYDPSGWRAALRVRRYVKDHAIAVAVCFHFVADCLGVLARAGRGGLRVISSRRDMGFTRTSRQIYVGRWLDRGVDRYIAVSEAVRQAVARDERVDPAKIEVIHNGSDIEALDRDLWDATAERARRGIGADEVVIGCIANFNPVKQHLTLLEAFARLRRERPDAPLRLLLAGDGPMRPAIEARIAQLGLGNRVILAGRSRQVSREYQMTDLFVLPSETEGFSNAILQAMVYRKPVVACRVGGNPEAVEEGVTGLLAPARDPAALAEALGRLVDDGDLRRRMGEAGRERAEREFSLGAMLERTQALIERVARGEGRNAES